MSDMPACLSAVADYLTFLARYPSFDALYWDCRHGGLIVPVALAGGWPRAGLSHGADPTLADAAGQRPGQRAREQGLVEAADLLDAAAAKEPNGR